MYLVIKTWCTRAIVSSVLIEQLGSAAVQDTHGWMLLSSSSSRRTRQRSHHPSLQLIL